MFQFSRLEKRGVEIGYSVEELAVLVITLILFLSEHLEEKTVEIVVTVYSIKAEEGKCFVAFVITYELSFEQFEEEDAVDPCNRELKSNIEKPFVFCTSV